MKRSISFARALLVFTAIVLLPAASDAQVPAMPVKVCALPAETTLDATFVDALTADYNQGNWASLLAKARQAIDEAKSALAPGCPNGMPAPPTATVATLLDDRVNYVAVSWVGTNPLENTPMFMRIVVHVPATAPFALDLPGIAVEPADPQLAEVFVSRSAGAGSVTLFASTREDNPLTTQLPAFVQAITGPLFGTIGALASPPGHAKRIVAAREPLFVTVSRVSLPFRRAAIKFRASARDSVDREDFRKAVLTLPTALKLKEAAYSICARTYADDLATSVATVIDDGACATTARDPAACMQEFDSTMVGSYARAIGGTLAGCTQAQAKAEVDAMQDVDQKFRTLVASGSSSSADADVTFHNRPLTRWSLGAGSAVMAYAKLNLPRVDVDKSGNIVADPLSRVMTLAFVNWSAAGYDETAPAMRPSERFRLFFGAVLTSDFGVAGGANVMLVRGIGVCAGVGVLFANGAVAGDIGKPPADPTDPYRLATVGAAFVGISYNFK